MSEKRTKGAIIFFSSLIYLLTFLLFFYSSYVESAHVFFAYASSFIGDFVFFVLSAVFFGLVFKIYLLQTVRAALCSALLFALPYLFYSIPHRYVTLTLGGYRLTDVLILLVFDSLFSFLLSYSTIVAMCLSAIFVYKKIYRGEKKEALVSELSKARVLDMESRGGIIILISVGLLFLYYLISELISTVSYVIDYAGEYRTGEIIYIAARYLFLLFSYFIAYLLTRLVLQKNNA